MSFGQGIRSRRAMLTMLAGVVALSAAPLFAAGKPFSTGVSGSAEVVVQFIDQQLRQGWQDNGVEPSPVASDEEWLRRVYLDLVGHVPPAETVEEFVKDKDQAKRSRVIDQLLDDPAYVRHWTTVWTNLLIGQTTPRRVSRSGMQKFLREAFTKNRPWNEIVADLVTADGRFDENGAVNYLLAQMQDRDEGVQATAKTARLFLGLQVQCTQCHNHPFNDWKQDQFWQMNSFFRQVRRVDHRKLDPKTGQQVDDYSELVWQDYAGPVYFEKRSGLMQVAYPIFQGHEVDPGPATDRRKELARLMTEGDKSQIALALVNRLWGHCFGYGFTRPIDDLGPHNPPTHPELLDRLAKDFVQSGYDVKQLLRWITNSEAYQLTSQSTKKNERDNPAAGEAPLFSHPYLKPLTAEQLYDSLIVATSADKAGKGGWEEAEKKRREWLGQFVQAFGNDMGEESSTFDGTIPQALMMMNGPLVQQAVSAQPGSHLHSILTGKGADAQKIQHLYLAALGRHPERREITAIQKGLRTSRDPLAFYQDLFWALLNSNEFIFNH